MLYCGEEIGTGVDPKVGPSHGPRMNVWQCPVGVCSICKYLHLLAYCLGQYASCGAMTLRAHPHMHAYAVQDRRRLEAKAKSVQYYSQPLDEQISDAWPSYQHAVCAWEPGPRIVPHCLPLPITDRQPLTCIVCRWTLPWTLSTEPHWCHRSAQHAHCYLRPPSQHLFLPRIICGPRRRLEEQDSPDCGPGLCLCAVFRDLQALTQCLRWMQGRNGAISVIALAERGALFDPGPCMYMDKLAGLGPCPCCASRLTCRFAQRP